MKPTELKILFDLLSVAPAQDRPNLAILTETEFLFCYKSKLTYSQFVPGGGPVNGLRPLRGDVMDFFTRLEFIVNQILIAHLTGSAGDTIRFEEVLDCVDLFSKARLLDGWGLIDRRTRELLHRLRAARNGFAHSWEIEAIRYTGKPILDVFHAFKADARAVFDALIRLYNGEDVDVDGLTKALSGNKLPDA